MNIETLAFYVSMALCVSVNVTVIRLVLKLLRPSERRRLRKERIAALTVLIIRLRDCSTESRRRVSRRRHTGPYVRMSRDLADSVVECAASMEKTARELEEQLLIGWSERLVDLARTADSLMSLATGLADYREIEIPRHERQLVAAVRQAIDGLDELRESVHRNVREGIQSSGYPSKPFAGELSRLERLGNVLSALRAQAPYDPYDVMAALSSKRAIVRAVAVTAQLRGQALATLEEMERKTMVHTVNIRRRVSIHERVPESATDSLVRTYRKHAEAVPEFLAELESARLVIEKPLYRPYPAARAENRFKRALARAGKAAHVLQVMDEEAVSAESLAGRDPYEIRLVLV